MKGNPFDTAVQIKCKGT